MEINAQFINQIQQKLNTITKHQQPLTKSLNNLFISLIQSIFTSTTEATLKPIRTELLSLINTLDRCNFQLPAQLSILLIQNYAQLNRSNIHHIIQHNLDNNHLEFIQNFKLKIQQMVQDLTENPEDQHPQLARTLSLITQSHPQLLELFYQSYSKDHKSSPFISIVKIIESRSNSNSNSNEKLNQFTRSHLIFIVINVAKEGIINRLKKSTAAFDSTFLVDQLSVILSSNSCPFLSDFRSNYPAFLDDLKPLLASKNFSIHSKNHLNSFFINSNKFLLFSIFSQSILNDSISNVQNKTQHQSLSQNQIDHVIKSSKNLFDDHQIDVSLLRKGKAKLDEKAILNDKSHLTNSIKTKMKSRLEEIEMNLDQDDSDIPILYDDNDDDNDEEEEEEERLRKMKKSIQIDIFSDEDDLFFSNKTKNKKEEETDNSEEEEETNSIYLEEEEEEKGKDEGSTKIISNRNNNNNKFYNNNNNKFYNNNNNNNKKQIDQFQGKEKVGINRNDLKKQTQKDEKPERNAGGGGGGRGRGAGENKPRGQWRGGGGGGGTRGSGRGRGGAGQSRGGSLQPKHTTRENDKKSQSNSTPIRNIDSKEQNQSGETSTSQEIPNPSRPPHPPPRGNRAHVDHMKKSHDRRVRGRDRKLAQVSGAF